VVRDSAPGLGKMPRRNRVDPWGDLHSVSPRGLFTGNRGCLVDDKGELIRHHNGNLWITCRTQFKDWKHPLAEPRTWTPLFFLDDAVALAAGHRPCGLCRRSDYDEFRDAISSTLNRGRLLLAPELNGRIAAERYRGGRGMVRADDRILASGHLDDLPTGTIIIDTATRVPLLVTDQHLQEFSFEGWGPPAERPPGLAVQVLTPATSVVALKNGFVPKLHPSAHIFSDTTG
jgi:hypothetical protein